MPGQVVSEGDPRVERYRHLTDSAARRSLESAHGVFVLEGARVVRTAVDAGWKVVSLLLLPSALRSLSEVAGLVAGAGGEVLVADRPVMDAIAGFGVHRGVLGLAARPPQRDAEEVIGSSQVVVVVEGVNDHENLGSIFRNSAAFGVGAVLLDPTTCDPLYRRSVRVSMGHALTIPFSRLAPWPGSLGVLERRGFDVVALSPRASLSVDEVARRRVGAGAPPIALMIGAEGPGLSDAALMAAAFRARIPIATGVDSLNVATALAVALHVLGPSRDLSGPSR
jgi:tRNA G18 (ribose-2'-O)-methylase SpoU